jgi:uncharacterized membrane protein
MLSKLKPYLIAFSILGFLFLGSTGIALIAGAGPTEGFTLESIGVVADVQPDGSMEVTERVAYDFQGDFGIGSRTFDAPRFVLDGQELDGPFSPTDWQITDIQATTADGEPLETVTDTPTLFEWQLDPSGARISGEREYELTYTVVDAIALWEDVGELEWQWIGSDYPEVDRFSAQITMPTGEGVRAWGHGPLDGEVSEADGGTVTFTVDGVPYGQLVETRLVAPASAFDGDPIGPPMLDEILAEEGAEAGAANAQRQREQDEANALRLARGALTVLMAVLVPLALLLFWLIWRRWGKEPDPPADVGEYWREVPDDPPAVAVALKGFGTVDGTAFAATAVDLAQRGYLSIEEEEKEGLLTRGTEYRFRRLDQPADGLLPFESTLLAMLFRAGDQEITQTELQAWARAHQGQSQKLWQRFQDQVKAEEGRRGYIMRGRIAPFLLPVLLAVVVVGVGILGFVLGAWIAGIAGIAVGLLLLGLTILMRQRTPEGARRFAMWDGLGRFLEDFSRLGDDDVRVADKAIYERYVVAAVALGVADKLVEGMRLRVPEVAQDPSFASWYVGRSLVGAGGVSHGLAGMGNLSTFASHFGGGATSAFTPRSSGSGVGGGGFSGGGGGGGGGGGFGAR